MKKEKAAAVNCVLHVLYLLLHYHSGFLSTYHCFLHRDHQIAEKQGASCMKFFHEIPDLQTKCNRKPQTFLPKKIKVLYSSLTIQYFNKRYHRFRLIHNTAFLLAHSNTLLDPDSICTFFSCLFRFSSASLSFRDNLATRRCWSHAKTIFSSSFHMAHRSRLARKSAHE